MGGRFKTNMNQLKKDSSAFETGGSGANWFKLVDGKQVVRLLPPWSEEGLFYMKVGYHRPPGRSTDKVVCPDYTFDKKGECPICKARARVFKDLGKDAAKMYNIQKRALVNVLDMKKADGVVYVMDSPASIMNPILNFMAEEESDQLVDPEKGYNILINRKNDGGFTKYETMIKPGEYNLEDNNYDVDDILENLNELDKFIKEPDPDDFTEILEAMNAAAYEDDEEASVGIDDDDDDEVPKAKAKAKPKKKLKSKKVEEEDDDDDDDDDEEEETPKAKRSKLKKKAGVAPVDTADPDDDEEDEDDDDEEEEEPAPKPKKKLKKKAKKKAEPVDEDEDELDVDMAGIDDDFEPSFDVDEEIPF